MSESLCGSWKLVHWRRLHEDGSKTYPLGADATGCLLYTADGRMAVQMAAAGRATVQTSDPLGGSVEDRAGAYSGYLAYFGGYTATEDTVTHRIEASLYPNWSGAAQSRPYTLEHGRLVLRTPPTTMPDGSVVVNEMSWARES